MRTKYFVVCWALLTALLIPAGLLRAQEEAGANPLLDISSDMNVAASHLGKLRTGKPTQEAQKNAVKKIDLLIAELEKRLQSGRGGQVNPNPSQPARDSSIRNGPGGMGKLHAERREGKQWGELPAKERERILQSLNEGFPSYYRAILERYFARLADEKSISETSAPEDGEKPRTEAAPDAAIQKDAPVKDRS